MPRGYVRATNVKTKFIALNEERLYKSIVITY
jgi:hypothetical protein